MNLNKIKVDLEKQGYRIVGNHSAIKVCLWCKKSLLDEDVCYKNKFYGIKSWRCIQTSISLFNCYHLCNFCWRDLTYTKPVDVENPDKPKFIIDKAIEAHKEYLQGFKGNKKVNLERFNEAMNPKHFALSLAGDACLYPKLQKLITEIHNRNMTSFLVTNGTKPEMLKKLLKNQPTQTYVTLPAPDQETYLKVCKPLVKNSWKKILKSLKFLENFRRSTIRLTLLKETNMFKPEKYAEILKNLDIKFIELKAAMPVGYAQYRIKYKQMAQHNEIKDFAKKILKSTNLKVIDEKKESRVVLLAKKDYKDRKLKFQ